MNTLQAPLVKPQAEPSKRAGYQAGLDVSKGADINALNAIMVLQSRAMSHELFAAAAHSVVSDLAILLGCERVSLGLLEQRRIRMTTISGVSDFRAQQDAVARLASAMQEAVDQRCAVVHPLPTEKSHHLVQEHDHLAQSNGGLSICTLPIVSGGKALGALLFEKRESFDPPTIQLAQDCALFVGPLLILQYRAENSFQNVLQKAVGIDAKRQGPSFRKLAAIACLSVLVVVGAWPTTYRVVAEARVEGEVQRVLAAPVDGFVRSVAVRPGESVVEGQEVLKLDDQDLVLESQRLQSELTKVDKQYRDAMSKYDAAAIMIAASELEAVRSQLALAQRHMERTALTAPFDGVVISGDLTQSIGMPVQRGQELMTMATERAFRIVIKVDEQDVTQLRVGQEGNALFAALPNPVAFQVTRIAPLAQTVDGKNIFEVEGSGAQGAGLLRPGLSGVGKIAIKPSFVAAVWWHRAGNWLRRIYWRLSG